MTKQTWRTLADLAKRLDDDRHEAGKNFLEIAERQAKRGTIAEADLALIRKHYGRTALDQLSTDEYVRLRKSGEYDRLEAKFALTPAEIAQAESALRKAGTREVTDWHEKGLMEPAEARRMLAQMTSVDPEADDKTVFSEAAEAVEKDKLAPPPDDAAFQRNLRRAGIDTRALTAEQLAEHRDDFKNLALVSSGLQPKARKAEHPMDVVGGVESEAPAPEAA